MRQHLRCALGVLMITAACGGGDPPGGGNGNGDTDGGGTTDGTTGNGGRNPLIDVIPGIWETTVFDYDGDAYPCDCTDAVLAGTVTPENPCLCAGQVTVDPNDPDCSRPSVGVRSLGSPGDACIYLYTWREDDELRVVSLLILDGETVRAEHDASTVSGQILDDGWRIRQLATIRMDNQVIAAEHRKLR